MAGSGEYLRLVAHYWWATLIGGILSIGGLVGFIVAANESWLKFAVAGLLLLVIAQFLVGSRLIAQRHQPGQNLQVTNNITFAPGSNPTFTTPPAATHPLRSQGQGSSQAGDDDTPDN